MKRLVILLAALISIVLFSCEKEQITPDVKEVYIYSTDTVTIDGVDSIIYSIDTVTIIITDTLYLSNPSIFQAFDCYKVDGSYEDFKCMFTDTELLWDWDESPGYEDFYNVIAWGPDMTYVDLKYEDNPIQRYIIEYDFNSGEFLLTHTRLNGTQNTWNLRPSN